MLKLKRFYQKLNKFAQKLKEITKKLKEKLVEKWLVGKSFEEFQDLNQVSSVSLVMTSATALANEGLFELTKRPS